MEMLQVNVNIGFPLYGKHGVSIYLYPEYLSKGFGRMINTNQGLLYKPPFINTYNRKRNSQLSFLSVFEQVNDTVRVMFL